MTEQEWQGCDAPRRMMGWALSPGGTSDWAIHRKWWLFAVACGRQNTQKMECQEFSLLLDALEQYADGQVGPSELREAFREAGYPRDLVDSSTIGHDPAHFASGEVDDIVSSGDKSRVLGHLFRDIFANPFRPVVIDPDWRTPTVVSLAHAAYQERMLPSCELEPVRLAVLADALEDMGCQSAAILSHLRDKGMHVRGCWVVDALRGPKRPS